MGLEELQLIIADSDRGDWNVISCFRMPSYLPWSPDGDFNEHNARAAYRPDVSIGLAWGIEESEDFQTDWVAKLDEPLGRPSPSIVADVLYNGMVVVRELLVLVEGAKCYLPIPGAGSMSVSQWEHDFAKLVDELSLSIGVGGGLGDLHRSDFAGYFRRAGLSVEG